MEERGKDEDVATRAKGKAKKTTGTRRDSGHTASASGTTQKVEVCSILILTTFRKPANQAKDYHSCPGQPKV